MEADDRLEGKVLKVKLWKKRTAKSHKVKRGARFGEGSRGSGINTGIKRKGSAQVF